jgi:hypothetical protein
LKEKGVHRTGEERNEKVTQEKRNISETGGVNGIGAKRSKKKSKIKEEKQVDQKEK